MTHLLLCIMALFLMQDSPFGELLRRLEAMSPPERAPHVEKFLAGRSLPLVESDTALAFLWYGAADSVQVNGALQGGWAHPARMEKIPCAVGQGGPALFYKRYTVPRDARLEYRFLVDGVSTLDPRNVRLTANGDFSNSEAAMPGFVPTRWTASRAGVPHGTLDTLLFAPRDTTLKPRRVIVFVPGDPASRAAAAPASHAAAHGDGGAGLPGAPAAGRDGCKNAETRRWASIYVHDGETALRYLALTTVLENMQAEREIPPVVAVFVPSVEREAEYMGRKQTRYINALADELVPLIERRYPVVRDAGRRGITGISAGGHAALAAGLARPEVFGLCAGQSSPITPALGVLLDVRARIAPLPRTFGLYHQCGLFDIASGQYPLLQLNREFSGQVAGLPIRHRYVETSDGHDWPSWREQVPAILRFFFIHQQ